jgi:hypothetical protein
MADECCAPGCHLGEDVEGYCSCCAEAIDRPGLWLMALVVVGVVLVTVLAIRHLLSWLMAG